MNIRAAIMAAIVMVICGSGLAPAILADEIHVGDAIRLEWVPEIGPDPLNGGPFVLNDLTTGDSWISFCLELNEFFHLGELMQVDSLSKQAVRGGVGGGNPDPLSIETAWLYRHFREGDLWSITGIPSTNGNLFELQNAIWILEDEKSGQGNIFIDYLTQNGPASLSDLSLVSVVNPVIYDGTGAISQYKQSQLAYTPAPEPGSILLLGTGLAVVGLAALRKRK